MRTAGDGGECAEAKRLGQRGMLVLLWVLLVASVALSTLLQIAVAPRSLVGYLTAGRPGLAAGLVCGAEPAVPCATSNQWR
jgi:hypothetical protein